MDSVNAGSPKAQPFSLLEQLGGYEDIPSYWEDLEFNYDEDITLQEIISAVVRCLDMESKTPTEEIDAIILDQLRAILTYESEESPELQAKKIQLLQAATKDHAYYNQKQIKVKMIEMRLRSGGLIVKAMCYRHPKIAFQPCPDNHDIGGKSFLPSAFQLAAESRSEYILQIILDELLVTFEHDNNAYSESKSPVQQPQEIIRDGETAEKNMAEVVELLLNTFASLPLDVSSKVMDIIKIMVGRNPSLLNEKTWEIAVKTPSPEFVRLLLESNESKFLTEAHALFVVEKGTAQMWDMFPEKSRRSFLSKKNCNFLHIAVSLGKVDMVEVLLKLEPTLIEIIAGEAGRESHEYPIQYLKKLEENPKVDEDGKAYKAIRDLLVHAMIRSQNFGLQKIREILKDSNVEAKDMSFQFPQFKSDAKNQSCTDYVQMLKVMNAKFFQYEKLLKYATFPDLSGQAPFMGNEDLKQVHREVKDVFDWLKERGVEEVMTLTVEDRLHCPHSDEDVAACVNNFRVRVLKWRKLDIYLKNIDKDSIEELHLYSSGNQSVHDQWLVQIPQFKRLKRLYVYVVKDVLSPLKIDKVKNQLQEDLNTLHGNPGYPWTIHEEEASIERDGDSERQDKIQSNLPKTQPRITSEAQSKITPEITLEIMSEIQPGILTKISPDFQPDISAGISPDIQPDILAEIPSEIQTGILAEIPSEIPSEIQTGILTKISPDIQLDTLTKIPSEIQPGITTEIQSTITPEILTEISPKIPAEMVDKVGAKIPTELLNRILAEIRAETLPTQPKTRYQIEVVPIQWLQLRENIIYRSLDHISSDLVGSHLARFIQNFSQYHYENIGTKKTKIALIDSGVVVVGGSHGENYERKEGKREKKVREEKEGREEKKVVEEREENEGSASGSVLAQRIVEGISLVSRDNEEQPWWHATEPHGTQMATLICSINPFCELYVVKVAESNASGITGHNVAKAIDWARTKGVDIISLSLVTFSDPNKDMAAAIQAAKRDDIVITCSTADEGSIVARSVGEKKNDSVLSIAACDKWGNLLPQSQKTGFTYQFIGHNVHVGQVPYLESAESIEGSSVSTAVAAGMASLILACARISSSVKVNEGNDKGDRTKNWRFDTVKGKFDAMSKDTKGWVVLENLCGPGRLEKPYDFKKLVDETFTN